MLAPVRCPLVRVDVVHRKTHRPCSEGICTITARYDARVQRWIRDKRVVREVGVAQEIHALLVAYQALRIAISDATISACDIDPDRASVTVALDAARQQVIQAAGVIADTTVDLVGAIGRQVLGNLLPQRRCRSSPRVVKRAISVYAPNTPKGRLRAPSHQADIGIHILTDPDP